MVRLLDLTVSALLLLAGILLFAMTFSADFEVVTFGGDVGPAFAPRLFLVPWIVLAAVIVVHSARTEPSGNRTFEGMKVGQMLACIAIVLITAFAITEIGFVFAMIPGIVAFCLTIGYRNLPVLIAVVLLSVPGLWALFTFVFELLLPRSPWFNQI